MQYILDNLYWLLPLFITSVLTPIVSYIVGKNKTTHSDIKQRLDDTELSLRVVMSASTSILRRELKNSANLLISEGFASVEDKDLWEADYQLYENMIETLGMENGLIEHLRDEVLALPTIFRKGVQ